jgi:hypothetical protein
MTSRSLPPLPSRIWTTIRLLSRERELLPTRYVHAVHSAARTDPAGIAFSYLFIRECAAPAVKSAAARIHKGRISNMEENPATTVAGGSDRPQAGAAANLNTPLGPTESTTRAADPLLAAGVDQTSLVPRAGASPKMLGPLAQVTSSPNGVVNAAEPVAKPVVKLKGIEEIVRSKTGLASWKPPLEMEQGSESGCTIPRLVYATLFNIGVALGRWSSSAPGRTGPARGAPCATVPRQNASRFHNEPDFQPIAVTAIIPLQKQSGPKKTIYRPLYTETVFRLGSGRLSVHIFNLVRPICPMYSKAPAC